MPNKNQDNSKTSIQITCKCGKFQSWISEQEITQPCPNCGKQYTATYDRKILGLKIIDMKPRLNAIGFVKAGIWAKIGVPHD